MFSVLQLHTPFFGTSWCAAGLVSTLRRIADRLEVMSPEEVIEPLTMLSEPAHALIRRAEAVLQAPLGSPPGRPH